MICIPEVGDIDTFHGLSWTNALGGTALDMRGVLSFRAKITKAWDDWECGWRFHGQLLSDLEVVDDLTGPTTLRKGTTVHLDEFNLIRPK